MHIIGMSLRHEKTNGRNHMNIVDIIILAILFLSVIYGLYRGFIRTLLNVGCLLGALFVAFSFSGKLADAVLSNEGIVSTLSTYTESTQKVGDLDLAGSDVSSLTDSLIEKVLENVNLPEPIAVLLRNNLSTQSFAQSGVTSVNDYVSGTIVSSVVDILSFLLCFAAAYIVLALFMSLIHHIFKFKVLRAADSLVGGAFGLLRGFLLLYILFLLVPVLSTIIPLDAFDEAIDASKLASLFASDGFFAQVIAGKLF